MTLVCIALVFKPWNSPVFFFRPVVRAARNGSPVALERSVLRKLEENSLTAVADRGVGFGDSTRAGGGLLVVSRVQLESYAERNGLAKVRGLLIPNSACNCGRLLSCGSCRGS